MSFPPAVLMTSKRTLPPRPVTHMEMQAEPKKDDPMLHIKDFGPPRTHTVIGPAPPRPPPPQVQPPQSQPLQFQPPQVPPPQPEVHPHPRVLPLSHASNIPKEIMSPPEPIAHITRMPPIAGTQIPSFPPPPPPRFHPEGRSSSVSEINPDAEMVVEGPASQGPPSSSKGPGEPRKHHLLILN